MELFQDIIVRQRLNLVRLVGGGGKGEGRGAKGIPELADAHAAQQQQMGRSGGIRKLFLFHCDSHKTQLGNIVI